MPQQVTQEMKARAEVCYGDETCREKFSFLLEQKGLPSGLLTLQDIQECGYVKETGFVWLRHNKKRDLYKFEDVVISFDDEITAFFEPNKIKKLTGVKAKGFMLWVTLTEIYVDQEEESESPLASITFKTLAGFSRSFPASVFKVQTVSFHDEADEAKDGN
ncbi:hypothetical protein CCACVL1_28631 [Corchorus capsularis]|uniref:DUF538 domain-containing protein n=1 Tax=Corchorus capsularis TaxID=210143 RepID=A0A1R3G5U7_COCAP|nr:hypothetical protein CCACVL1_28631 [Corchorus capsularis]